MPRSLRQKIADALRLVFPSRERRAYIRLIRQSGAFDRTFYFASNPRLHPLFRLFPERHYVCEGEAMGLCPTPQFSPYAYLHHNPDLRAAGTGPGSFHGPFGHYILAGRAEGRAVMDPAVPAAVPVMPVIGPRDRPSQPAPVAVVLHLFYPALWPEFRDLLAAQTFAHDLFVTLTGPAGEDPALAAAIRAACPQARVWVLPNAGRDILPFLHLAGSGVLDGYAAVCKLHGKASPHRSDGDDWRRDLVGGIVGDPAPTAARLAAFLSAPDLGLWVADGHLMRGADWWGTNRAIAQGFLSAAGVAADPAALHFPAGSIYWLKPAVIAGLAGLGLTPADFGPERGLVDGTPAHAVERSLGYLVAAAGLVMCETAELDRRASGNGGLSGGSGRQATPR